MSDARERLVEAGHDAMAEAWGWLPDDPPTGDAPIVLDAFLDHPDDLIACLVESGALERFSERGPACYRRTEGGKP